MNFSSNFHDYNLLINFVAIKSMNCNKKCIKPVKYILLFWFMRMSEKQESTLCACPTYGAQKCLIPGWCGCA